jgi:hypothetical protein
VQPGIAHDAGDFTQTLPDHHGLADGIAVGPLKPCKRLGYEDNTRLAISRLEAAASDHRYLE